MSPSRRRALPGSCFRSWDCSCSGISSSAEDDCGRRIFTIGDLVARNPLAVLIIFRLDMKRPVGCDLAHTPRLSDSLAASDHDFMREDLASLETHRPGR